MDYGLHPTFVTPDPEINVNDPVVLNKHALWDEDWQGVRAFQEALQSKQLELCLRCRERWFDMKLSRNGVCARYHNVDRCTAENPN